MTWSFVRSGRAAISSAAAALTCGAAKDVPSTVPSGPTTSPAGASCDDPEAARSRGTVVRMPTPGAARSLNTPSRFEKRGVRVSGPIAETPSTWGSAAG